jgi:hypothetical protein
MHTLRQLHAELGGKLIDNKSEARRIVSAMKQVEAVMKLLQPGYDVRPIAIRRRKPNPWFKRGTVFRQALDALRRSGTAMTARQAAEAMLAAKGIQDTPAEQVRVLVNAVQASLQHHEGKSVIRVGEGSPGQWQIAIHQSQSA